MNLDDFLGTSTSFYRADSTIQGSELFNGIGWFCLRGNMETPIGLKFRNVQDQDQDEFPVQILATPTKSLVFCISQRYYGVKIENQYCRSGADEKPPTICLELDTFNLLLYPHDKFDSKALGEAYLKRCIQSIKECNSLAVGQSEREIPISAIDCENEWVDLIQKASLLTSGAQSSIKDYVEQLKRVSSLNVVEENKEVADIKTEIARMLRKDPLDLNKLALLQQEVERFEYQCLMESTFKL